MGDADVELLPERVTDTVFVFVFVADTETVTVIEVVGDVVQDEGGVNVGFGELQGVVVGEPDVVIEKLCEELADTVSLNPNVLLGV